MDLRGTLTGPAARKYPDFVYRSPLQAVTSFGHGDPSIAPSPYEHRADYCVTIGPAEPDGMATVRLRLLPNILTRASEPRTVLTMRAAHPLVLRHLIADEAVRRAFS